MTKIGFAVTLYDKFDELEQFINIVRSWSGDYYISVCCNHPDAMVILGDMLYNGEIDVIIKPRDIAQLGMHNDSKINKYAQNVRCTENVRASCKALEDSGCDIGVHVHSDCWFLNEEKMLNIVRWMKNGEYKVATRGHGLEESFHPMRQVVFGHVDDHAIFWDVNWCKDNHVWDFKPEAMMYHKHGVHTQLGMVFGVRVGLDNWSYYPHKSFDVFGEKTRSLSPVNYDPINEIIHVNTGALPHDWGKRIQQYYLSGKESDIHDILYGISKWNHTYDWWLSKCGFSKKQLEAISPVHKKLFLEHMTLKQIMKNYKHRVIDYIIDKSVSIPKDAKAWYKTNGYIDELVGKDNWTRRVHYFAWF